MPVPLHPAVQAHLDASTVPDPLPDDVRERRRLVERELDEVFERFSVPGPEVARVEDHEVPVDGGTVLVRAYHPPGDGGTAGWPAHVLLHGGGWTTGSIRDRIVDAQARHRAVGAGCVALAVGYRLAPEHRFPTAVRDVVTALRWIAEHAEPLRLRAGATTLGGSSAGANLAVASLIADPALDVRALVLEVPLLDVRSTALDDDVRRADPRFAPTERRMLAQIVAEYLETPEHADSPLASPVVATDLSGLPETHLFTAQLDLLRFGAERFAERLSQAGVPVTIRCYEGALHGSAILTRSWPTARRQHDDVLETLRDLHRRSPAPGPARGRSPHDRRHDPPDPRRAP